MGERQLHSTQSPNLYALSTSGAITKAMGSSPVVLLPKQILQFVPGPIRVLPLVLLALFFLPHPASSQSGRVNSLLGAMTLEEKLTFLRGATDPDGELSLIHI